METPEEARLTDKELKALVQKELENALAEWSKACVRSFDDFCGQAAVAALIKHKLLDKETFFTQYRALLYHRAEKVVSKLRSEFPGVDAEFHTTMLKKANAIADAVVEGQKKEWTHL